MNTLLITLSETTKLLAIAIFHFFISQSKT